MLIRVITISGALLLVAGVGGFLCVACTDDTGELEERLGAVESQLTGVQRSSETTSLLVARAVLSGAGLHDLDEAANTDGEVPAGAAGGVDSAILAMSAVAWPADLQSAADDLLTKLRDLAETLDESTDAEVVAPVAREAHDAWHAFDHEIASYVEDGGVGHGDEASGTPEEGSEHEEDEEHTEESE